MFIKNKKRAFTLVELMIVIAIIGILAVTIIPSLTGAQGRARDTGRMQNVRNAHTALVTFQGDYGYFPKSTSIAVQGCFTDANGKFNDNDDGQLLGDMLSGNKGLTDPQKGRISKPCNLANSLGYASIQKDEVDDASFVITTNVENVGNANYLGTNLENSSTSDNGISLEGYTPCILNNSGATVPSGISECSNKTTKSSLRTAGVSDTLYVQFYE